MRQSPSQTDLLLAIDDDDGPAVEQALGMGADIDLAGPLGLTPCMRAARRGSAKALMALIEAGAGIHDKDPEMATALALAANHGHRDCLALLCATGADPSAEPDSTRWSPAMKAAAEGWDDVLSVLLGAGANPDTETRGGTTALRLAAVHGQTECLRILIDAGANLESMGKTTLRTPAAACAAAGSVETLRMLLDAGANPDALDSESRSPAMLAADEGHLDCLRALLATGADMEARCAMGRSLLDYAGGQADIAALLLAHQELRALRAIPYDAPARGRPSRV